MRIFDLLCIDDKYGYCKHRIVGGLIMALILLFFFQWEASILGLFVVFFIAKRWEVYQQKKHNKKPNIKDVLQTLVGAVVINSVATLIYLTLYFHHVTFNGLWYLVF